MVIFILHTFLLAPQKEISIILKNKLADKNREYDISKVAGSKQFRAHWVEQMKHLNEKLGNFVADPNNLDDLAFSISKIASQTKVTSFASRTGTGESYSEIPNCYHLGRAQTNIGFKGAFNKFARFINALERHRPVVFVQEFTISRSPKDYTEHSADILLSVFVRIPPQHESEE